MLGISHDELQKLSHLDIRPGDPRVVPLYSCYRGEDDWEIWTAGADGILIKLIGKPIEHLYFGKQPASENDGLLKFFEVITKHLYFSDVATFSNFILDDILNLSASVAKLDLLFDCWRNDRDSIGQRFVVTEIEYLFGTCRSMFDLLHKVIVHVLAKCAYLDDTKVVTQKLPQNSFQKMAMDGDSPRTPEGIAAKWKLPLPFGQFYHKHAPFFGWMRDYRNAIEHHGKQPSPIFITERGFAVDTTRPPFNALKIWCEANMTPKNALGSVRSLVGYLITETLSALEGLAAIFAQITLPNDIAPGYRVWIRGPFVNRLKALEGSIVDDPWYN